MSTINVFNHVTLDGYYAGPNGEIDWFKSMKQSADFDAYKAKQSGSGGALLFGRTTYEMMTQFWPTPAAEQLDPKMTKIMRESKKIVISKSLKKLEETPTWKNLELRHDIGDFDNEGDVTILGSGTIVQQLMNRGLINELQLIVVPLILGKGKSLFKDVKETNLELKDSRSFSNGVVVMTYKSAA